MTFKYTILIAFTGFLLGCGASKKSSVSSSEKERLENLVAQKSFEIECDLAMPLMTNSMNSLSNAGLFPPGSTPNQISLIGNSNYLKIMGDSVAAALPYYGERQFGGGYDRDGVGVTFSGNPENYESVYDEKKHSYNIRFSISNNMERFNVSLVLFPGLTSTIVINSNQRFAIRYSGTAKAISEE
jgi:hypothetical protein